MASRSAAYSCLSSSWLFFFWVGFLLAAGFASAFFPAAPSCFPPVAAFLFLGSLLAFSLIGKWKRTTLISTTQKHDTYTLTFAKVYSLNSSVDRFLICLFFCSFVDSFVSQSFLEHSPVRFLFVCLFVRSFVRSFNRSFVRSFDRSFVPSFGHSFAQQSFVRSYFRSFSRLFVRSFVRPIFSSLFPIHLFVYIRYRSIFNSPYLFCDKLCRCYYTNLFFLFLARCGYTKESRSYRRNSKSHAQHTTKRNIKNYEVIPIFSLGRISFFHVVTELCFSIFDEIFGGKLFVCSHDIC